MLLNSYDIKKIEKKGNTVKIDTDGEPTLLFEFITLNAVKLYVDFTGDSVEDKSYAIECVESSVEDITVVEVGDYVILSSDELSVKIRKQRIKLDYMKNDVLLASEKETGLNEDGSIYCFYDMQKNEHFYGLGEDNDAYLGNMDRRGTTRDMITGQRINIGHVTADIPVTFFLSTGEELPYGIFVDNSYRMLFDMGKANEKEYFWKAEGGSFVQYFFCGNDFADILHEYTGLTGRPSLPPLWALGYTQCKCSYWCWDEVDEVINTFTEKKIPLDCVVFDFDWAENFHNFKWNSRWNGESPKKIAEYRKKGLHFMVSNSGPMIRKDSDNFQSALDAGILATDKEGNTVTCGHYGGELMDFSNPKMKEWIQPQLNRVLDDGIESWWLDLTEPEGDPDGTQYYDGDKAKVHNPFCLMNVKLYNEITLEYNKNKRLFILTRTGTAGIQKYNVSIWSGDVFSDYKTFSAHIPEALNTTMSGIPLWTSDSGGFMSSTNNILYNENIYKNNPASHGGLYERWLQFACFCPITRVHHAGQSSPYVFGERLTDSVAHYVRRRYRLLPYIYSYNYKAHMTGLPMMRALVLEYPKDKNVLDIKDEYLFGSEILVAPVTAERVTEREVYLPEGEWIDWDYGYCYMGGEKYNIYAPQNRIPVFVKRGAIIPMIKQVFNTGEIDWKHIILKIYPTDECSFEMYTDDGISYNFTNGEYTITDISCEEDKEKTCIGISRSNLLFAADEYFLEIHVNYKPESVCVGDKILDEYGYKSKAEGSKEGWYYDRLNQVLYVKVMAENTVLDKIIISNGTKLRLFSENPEEEQAEGQMPFLLPAASAPCKINCENYDRGGEGVAYHKVTENKSEIYRTENVIIDMCDDVGVGYSVMDLTEGEWLEYTINIIREGEYIFDVRARGCAEISIDVNSQNCSGLIKITDSKWQTASTSPVMLSGGEQVIRLFVHTGSIDANWIEIQLKEGEIN